MTIIAFFKCPNCRYKGYTYKDIMLAPIAEALGTALPAGMPIYFALQGEMGATVFRKGTFFIMFAQTPPSPYRLIGENAPGCCIPNRAPVRAWCAAQRCFLPQAGSLKATAHC